MTNPLPGAIERIHLIFKTHLDVGFTDFAAHVVANYFNLYIPKAIALAETMRSGHSGAAGDTGDRFVWTTGSWLIYEYLEQARGDDRRRMEAAIAQGDIAWHALPFTTHSENMDLDLFRFGLSLSHELDQRFGKHTIAAKMTDVPGHTRGIVPALAEAGVTFLHIGVNAASTPPDVPPVFVWRDEPSGAEVMVMYHKGSYGDLMVVPGLPAAIAFAHTGDNLGPQSPADLAETYRALHQAFPGVEICASTMDAFAVRLAEIKDRLPVITQEIGDTWIHGAGTDPLKEARYRALLRLRCEWLANGIDPAALRVFHRKLLQVPEHTWGLDLKTHLNDWVNYRAADFQAHRSAEPYQKMEASWREQRGYIQSALAALPDPLRKAAKTHLEAAAPHRPDRAGFEPAGDIAQPAQLGPFSAAFDPHTGAVTHLAVGGVQLAGPLNPLGRFCYETFSAADYARFHRQYNVNKRETHAWAIPDFTKPGLETAAPAHNRFLPRLVWAGRRATPEQTIYRFQLEMPEESWTTYGAPRQVWLETAFARREAAVTFDLQWFDKPATRLPEAAWLAFIPRGRAPHTWQMEKLGRWISPLEVIRDGNRHLHAVGAGVRSVDPRGRLTIETLDTALVAPGEPSLLNFTNRQPNLRQGWHFNLLNNLWGTNFPMWYEDDARFRFTLRWETD